MDELRTILRGHRSKSELESPAHHHDAPTVSDIPDVFFDDILPEYKLTRIEIIVLMYVYRRVWCRPNLYKVYGISQLMSHTEMAHNLRITLDEVYYALKKLEDYGIISTIRSGQYFVRRFFTKDLDDYYHQTYDDFEA